MSIELKQIEARIKDYQVELAVLRQTHDQMVATFQQQQQQFQERVAANQATFQQLTGALAELEQLRAGPAPTNNESPKRKKAGPVVLPEGRK